MYFLPVYVLIKSWLCIHSGIWGVLRDDDVVLMTLDRRSFSNAFISAKEAAASPCIPFGKAAFSHRTGRYQLIRFSKPLNNHLKQTDIGRRVGSIMVRFVEFYTSSRPR